LSRLILGVVIARPERPWQSGAFERFEIAASAFGLLLRKWTAISVRTVGDCRSRARNDMCRFDLERVLVLREKGMIKLVEKLKGVCDEQEMF